LQHEDIFYAALAVATLGFAAHALRTGKLSLSFATYNRNDRPITFYVWNALAILGSLILLIYIAAKLLHMTWLVTALS
jgi:lipid-A-disaccharide synthase-like uncharacterized protein